MYANNGRIEMNELNPIIRYTFKSRRDQTVTIKSRLGEDCARNAAMLHFYGPPDAKIPTRNGIGLLLLSTEPV